MRTDNEIEHFLGWATSAGVHPGGQQAAPSPTAFTDVELPDDASWNDETDSLAGDGGHRDDNGGSAPNGEREHGACGGGQWDQGDPHGSGPTTPRIVILPGGGVSITACATDLFAALAEEKKLFYRGGAIVELRRRDGENLELAVVDPAGFRSRMEHVGDIFVWRAGNNGPQVLKPTVCPEETAKALLASEPARELLPPIAALVDCPVIIGSPSGLRVLEKGYHRENGGVLVTAGEAPPQVELDEAIPALRGLLDEFDFQSEGDHSRALAQLITPGLKIGGLLKGFVPVDVAEADQSQSGKTFRQLLACAIYREKPSIIAKREGGVGSVDESFAQALVSGHPFIQLDNFRGKLDSQFIESFLTAESSFPARLPHRAEIRIDPRRFLLMLTSNGVETSPDMANRSCIVRIRKRTGHTFREYPQGDLLAHVRARQSYYLGCVFAVIRRWDEAGRLRTGTTEHDFRAWAQTLDWIVQHIFGAAPLLEGHMTAQKRVSNPALNFLRQIALKAKETNRLGVEISASSMLEIAQEHDLEIPGLRSMEDEGAAKRRIGTLMGQIFRVTLTVSTDGFQVERSEREVCREDGGGAHPAKFYRITEVATASTS